MSQQVAVRSGDIADRPDLRAILRCTFCRSTEIAERPTVSDEQGRILAGSIGCQSCHRVIAVVHGGKYNFHLRGDAFPGGSAAGTVVPVQGERRLRADSRQVQRRGPWGPSGQFLWADGRHTQVIETGARCSGAIVRMLGHPDGGLVDIFADDVWVAEVDTFVDQGSQPVVVWVPTDYSLRERKVTVRPRGQQGAGPGTSLVIEEIVLLGPVGAGFEPPAPESRGNPFTEHIEKYLGMVPDGNLILEIGGGDRRRCNPHHLNFEYLVFEFADMFGDTHNLPFQDDTFAFTFSQAVFEHVNNPFEAAEEIKRVTAPGGLCLTDVAFMQPIHAVPYHFFNHTPWGVAELFKDWEYVESDHFGKLSFTVDWLMRTAGLADSAGEDRVRTIVAELEELDGLISHDQLRSVASGVFHVARKPYPPADLIRPS